MHKQKHFKEIFDLYSDMVYNVCLNYLQNKENAEDVTQNTFLKVYENISQFKENSALKTWIYRIAINQSLDFIRSTNTNKRRGKIIPLFEKKNELTFNYEPKEFNHPGIVLEEKESLKNLMLLINTLPPDQKTALLLKTTEDLSIDEICVIMKMKNKAVNSLLVRARNNLKIKLNKEKSNN